MCVPCSLIYVTSLYLPNQHQYCYFPTVIQCHRRMQILNPYRTWGSRGSAPTHKNGPKLGIKEIVTRLI